VNCNGLRELLHPYFDGELDADRAAACEAHLRDCPDCSQALEEQRAVRAALADESFRYRPSPELRDRLTSQLAAPVAADYRKSAWRVAIIGTVAVVAGVAAAYLVAILPRNNSGDDPLVREVVSAHARSLLAEHLLDEKSSDRHTVKPWFQGRLDFSPPVPDLHEQDFTLAGGRLDYLDDHPVAALVYHRRLHVINLFVWPTDADDSAPQEASRRGFQLLHWTRGRLNFWAVSDVNAQDLREFARLVQDKS